MGFFTPDPQHPFTLPGLSMRTLNEKLWHWKRLIEDGSTTPTRAMKMNGGAKQARRRTRATHQLGHRSFSIPWTHCDTGKL